VVTAGGTGADSAGSGRERVRGGTKELRGEVTRLGARGIEARRREVAGIGTGAASGVQLGLLGSAVHSVRREEGERGGENEHDSVRIRMGVCARWARFVGATRGDPNVEAGEALTNGGTVTEFV